MPQVHSLFKQAEAFVPPAHFAHDPVANDYDTFFSVLDFAVVPERDESKPWPGQPPHPERAYVKAQLVMIRQKIEYHTELRRFLVQHPALVLRLGFRPVVDPTSPWGFDVQQTVPCDRHLRRKLQYADNGTLQAILAGTVADLCAAVPTLGQTVAQDVKHIYAWVQENNPKTYVQERYNPDQQPRGDPDCQLGVKRSHNQGEEEPEERKEYLWGYGTGIATAKVGPEVECVLAEYTQTFDKHDVTYFQPLLKQTCANLGFHPRNFTADAAFDAWYVYEPFACQGGLACIPLNLRGHPEPRLGPHGYHVCAAGREMVGSYIYAMRKLGYTAQVERCPILFPEPTGEVCRLDHEQFQKGLGCVKHKNLSAGAQMRLTLDRHSPEYEAIYDQRTTCERINSQAVALGIERPKVRNFRSVQNRNTLIYIVINANVLHRVHTAQARAPT
jgi:hypothetical protein